MGDDSLPATYPIESVDNAAQILLAFRSRQNLRVADVAQLLGVARSTAHRMLTTLQARGLVKQDPETRSYGPGNSLVELGMAVIGAAELRIDVTPELDRLAKITGETSHYLVLDHTETVFVDGVEGRHPIRAVIRVGQRGPAHASAAGKVLLAQLSTDELRRRYPTQRLAGGTSRAVRTRAQLEAELARVREAGYATNISESEPDLNAASVAIVDSQGRVRGALSVSGPSQRLGEDLAEIVAALRTVADDLRHRLT